MFFLLLVDTILLCCSDSPVAATKAEEEAVNSPGAEHSKEVEEPQDSLPEGRRVREDAPVRDPVKAKGPAAQPMSSVPPFLLTQESEGFREDVSPLPYFSSPASCQGHDQCS